MSFSLKDDQRLRQKLEAAPSVSDKLKELPAADGVPELVGFRVQVPVKDITKVEVGARLAELVREHGAHRPRLAGEQAALGDDVRVTIIAHVNGKLLPGSIVEKWMVLEQDEQYPELAEQIAGMEIGEGGIFFVTLPDDFVKAPYRGKTAAFTVQLHEAIEVQQVDITHENELLKLGRGGTLEEVVRSIAEQLRAQRVDSAPMWGARGVFDALAAQSQVEIPKSLVDAEVRRRWQIVEGELMQRLGMGLEEQREALEGWLQDDDVRGSSEHDLRALAIAKTLIARENIAPTPQQAEAFLVEMAQAVDVTPQALLADIEAKPAVRADLDDVLLRNLLIDHIMKTVQIEFIDDDNT